MPRDVAFFSRSQSRTERAGVPIVAEGVTRVPRPQGADESAENWWKRMNTEERSAVEVWRLANSWHANQLRHSHGTSVRRRFGLEAAQVALGHERADVTQV